MFKINDKVAKHEQSDGRKAKMRGVEPTRWTRLGHVIEVGTGVDAGRVRVQWAGANKTWVAIKSLELAESAGMGPFEQAVEQRSGNVIEAMPASADQVTGLALWLTLSKGVQREMDKRPLASPINVQMMEYLNAVEKAMTPHFRDSGIVALNAFIAALRGRFMSQFSGVSGIARKYGLKADFRGYLLPIQ